MNKTRIEWTNFSLNTIVGCTHGCLYCYASRFSKRRGKDSCCYDFFPHPHLERLKKINSTQKPRKIFIDSMWDWNCVDVKKEWLDEILAKIIEWSQHTFQVLTKIPKKYSCLSFPKNVWLGTSITCNRNLQRVRELLDNTDSKNIQFVSVEPIHEKLDFWFSGLDQIIIGSETGNRKEKIKPKMQWISQIINNARLENIPVFIKDNVHWHCQIREFPEIKN